MEAVKCSMSEQVSLRENQLNNTWNYTKLLQNWLLILFLMHLFSWIVLAITFTINRLIVCSNISLSKLHCKPCTHALLVVYLIMVMQRERESCSAYPISREHSQMMVNSNKWATGRQWVMKSYQQSIIIKSLKCTSSTGKQTQLTSLCVSLHQSSSL